MFSTNHILKNSLYYIKNNIKTSAIFVAINSLIMSTSHYFGGWQHPSFFLFLLLTYVLWVSFFRVYFNTKPIFNLMATIHSLSPSIKIFIFMFILGAVLVFLPYIFMFLGLPIDFLEQYMDKTKATDAVFFAIFIVASPNILFRPYFAWIGSTIDRNYNLSFAFNNTKGHYIKFLTIFIIVNLLLLISEILISNVYLYNVISSIIFLYFNVILAKSYEFFFKI